METDSHTEKADHPVSQTVSTLPIRNGNLFSPLLHFLLACKYLTYKEWKHKTKNK